METSWKSYVSSTAVKNVWVPYFSKGLARELTVLPNKAGDETLGLSTFTTMKMLILPKPLVFKNVLAGILKLIPLVEPEVALNVVLNPGLFSDNPSVTYVTLPTRFTVRADGEKSLIVTVVLFIVVLFEKSFLFASNHRTQPSVVGHLNSKNVLLSPPEILKNTDSVGAVVTR